MNKLKKNNGITIIHALVSVLIFAIFSSIMFSATSTNMKSLAGQKEYQQAYLSVSSAAELFINSVDQDFVEYRRIVALDNNGNEIDSEIIESSWTYVDEKKTIDTEEVGNDNINNPLNNSGTFLSNFKDSFNSFTVEAQKHTMTIAVEDFTAEVIVEMQMKNKGCLYLNFYLNTPKKSNNYYMCVEIPVDENSLTMPNRTINLGPGIVKSKSYANTKTEVYRITYDASNAVIEKGKYEIFK